MPERTPERTREGAHRAARVVVRGRVQGVAFRASSRARARALGVAGRARNQPDGSVELWLEGPADALDAMLAFCREGPPGARVDECAVEWAAPPGLTGFEVQ